MPHPERILIVRLSHLGDVVHTLPLYHALRGAHPDAALGWAIQPEFVQLIEGLEGIERVFDFRRDGGARAWLDLRRELRSWRPDWTVDAQGNLKSGCATLLSGAARRSGWARGEWRERLGAWCINDPAPPARGRHALERALALADHLAPGGEGRWDLPLGAATRARGRELLERHLPRAAEGGAWILHPGVAGDRRSWPEAAFAALARRLAPSTGGVLVLSGPREAEVGARLAGELSSREDIRHWVGQRGLSDLAALFAAAAEHGARLVAGDSGPAHVAAAVGLGVEFLAGPQDPALTGPWPLPDHPGSPHRLHRAPGATPRIEDLAVEDVAARLLAGIEAAR